MAIATLCVLCGPVPPPNMNREGQSGNERREMGLVLLGKNGGIVCYMHGGNRALLVTPEANIRDGGKRSRRL